MISSRASAKRRCSLWVEMWVEIGPAQTLSPYAPQPEAGKFPGSLLGSRAHRPKARQPLGGFSCGRPLGRGVLLLCLGSLSLQALPPCLTRSGSIPGGRTIWPGPRTGSTKRMMVFYTLSPHHRELAGVLFAPAPAGGPGRLCACALYFFVDT